MPRGKPKAGVRISRPGSMPMGRPRKANTNDGVPPLGSLIFKAPVKTGKQENEETVSKRIAHRFNIINELARSTLAADGCRALIISGPAGVGKTHTIQKEVVEKSSNRVQVVKGYIKATGLFESLYKCRHEGSVLILDDVDSIFLDAVQLNMLKAVCDTSPVRTVSYLSKFQMFDEHGYDIPQTFDFAGSIIFITNMDFDQMIERSSKLGPHLKALLSRAHYVDLEIQTEQEYLVRIRQIAVGEGMLKNMGLNAEQQKDVLNYIHDNSSQLRELSLRTVIKVADLRKSNPKNWKNYSDITCLSKRKGK